jgi:Fe2+ or Zn2+ uptake regulation protein
LTLTSHIVHKGRSDKDFSCGRSFYWPKIRTLEPVFGLTFTKKLNIILLGTNSKRGEKMQKRNTIQRQLVIAAVRSLGNHPTAEQVYNDIILKYPDISKGTVYRNLNSLVESGLLSKVSVPSAADRYDYILTKHYHVQCTRCKKFINVKGLDYDQNLDDKIAQLTGFRMENHDIVFSGLCPECQIKEAAEKAKAAGKEPAKKAKAG